MCEFGPLACELRFLSHVPSHLPTLVANASGDGKPHHLPLGLKDHLRSEPKRGKGCHVPPAPMPAHRVWRAYAEDGGGGVVERPVEAICNYPGPMPRTSSVSGRAGALGRRWLSFRDARA